MDLKRKMTISLLFFIGLSIFSYPIISNWIQTKKHDIVITRHNMLIKNMSDIDKQAELKKAEAYNETLQLTEVIVSDPFNELEKNEAKAGYYDVLNIGEAMGHLEIPKLNIQLPIYHGVSDEVLQRGIGHMSQSSFPVGGKGNHAALTGHRGLPTSKLFRNLDAMEINDLFYIHTLDETLVYEVDQIDIVLPAETTWLTMDSEKDYITLITCEPYMINTHRLLVRGERIEGEQDVKEALSNSSITPKPFMKRNLFLPIMAGCIFFITFSLIYFVKRKSKRDIL